tara:strand:+ start:94 stop:423 length:330 start_codon:yes stop_codon:yes gene_type:complete
VKQLKNVSMNYIMEYSPGNFNFIHDALTREALKNTYHAVDKTNMWSFMKTFEPPSDQGFMFTASPELYLISTECENRYRHSGTTWGFSMRHIEYIAKNGWSQYVCMHSS